MSYSHHESLLLKAENPGSRGGIVVGYWPSGKPKYLSELKGISNGAQISVTTDQVSKGDGKKTRKYWEEQVKAHAGLIIPNKSLGKDIVFPGTSNLTKSISGARSLEDYSVIPYLPALVHHGQYIGSEKDKKAEEKKRHQIAAYHYLTCPITINGESYTVSIILRDFDDGTESVVRFYTHKSDRTEKSGSQRNGNLPPARGTIHRSSPDSHLAGIENINPKDNESQEQIQKAYISYQAIHKSSLKTKCHYCEMWEGTLCRVFRSEQDFMKSPYYGGGDRLENDPHGAEFAVWPGKTNANRPNGQWWICTPVHPNCSHSWESWSPERVSEFADEDWYQEAQDELNRLFNLNKSTLVPIVAENFLNLDQIIHRCEHSGDAQDWTTEYLRSRLLVNG